MSSTNDIFLSKYDEFARDLMATCPEFTESITAALALSSTERKDQFRNQVLPSCSPQRDATKMPNTLLPGVSMTPEIWESLSEKSKNAIQEYLTILSFCLLMDSASTTADLSGAGFTADWAQKAMEDMKEKMKGIDFSGLADKFSKIFGDSSSSSSFPQIPEKFLKGQIAKLAEEIVKEFRVEDFGLDQATMDAATSDPTKALQMIMDIFMKNPQSLQGTIMKLTKKLQQKIQSGSLRPQELVAEAEELMKTFSEHPQFVELMESLRSTFGMEGHEDELRASGNDGSARLSLVQQRLRKKLEAKKAATTSSSSTISFNNGDSSSNEFPSALPGHKGGKGKKK